MWSLAVRPSYDKSNSDIAVERVRRAPSKKVLGGYTQTDRGRERDKDSDRGEILFLKKMISCFLCQLVFLFTVLHS